MIGLARSGKDSVLIELRELSSRLTALLKRKGTAAEVIAISASVIRLPSEIAISASVVRCPLSV